MTSEVLPSIRKSGGYLAPAAAKALEDMSAAVQLLSEQMEELSGQMGELSGQMGELLDREDGEPVALAALPELRRQLGPGTIVLVKASHSMKFGWLVDRLQET